MRHERDGTALAAVQTLYFNRARPGCAFARKAVLSESIDDLTVEYEENGQIILKELDKIVLSKGAWTTILFRYQEWKPQTSSYGPDKYVIRRYKKMGGEYPAAEQVHHFQRRSGPQDRGRPADLDRGGRAGKVAGTVCAFPEVLFEEKRALHMQRPFRVHKG